MKYICDTNFIIRYLVADNQEMFLKTRKLFDQAKIGEVTLIIEQAVFTEVVFVLSSFYKVPKDKITQTLSELLAYKGIDSEREILLPALSYYQQKNIHIVVYHYYFAMSAITFSLFNPELSFLLIPI